MKTRRHHNNKGLRATQRGKRKKEVERMAKRLQVDSNCVCGHEWIYHGDGDHAGLECFYSYNCDCKGFRRPPLRDVFIARPEEEPGYGHGV